MSETPSMQSSQATGVEATPCADGPAADRIVSWQEALSSAEALLESPNADERTTLDRINQLLDQAAVAPDASRFHVAWTRARAVIALQLASDVSKADALEVLLHALSLSRDQANQDFRAFLGLGVGNFFVLLKDELLERRHVHSAHEAVGFSYDAYRYSSDEHAELATRLLSQVKLRLIELRASTLEDLVAVHRQARELAAAALVGHEAQRSPAIRGGCHEVAGLIAAAGPTGPSPTELAAAIAHLREAYRCYQREDERADVERCVLEILRLRSILAEVPSFATASALQQDLLALEWSRTGQMSEQLQFPLALFEAAHEWLQAAQNSDGAEAVAAFEYAAKLANRLATAPSGDAEPEMRIRGWFILGNALGDGLLTARVHPTLPALQMADARQRLAAAREAFGEALALLPEQVGDPMGTRVRIQLAKAFTAQFAGCGDRGCLDPAKAAWRDAISHAANDDVLHCRLNLVSVLLAAAHEGGDQDLEEAYAHLNLIEKTPEVASELQATLRGHRARFDALMLRPHGSAAALDYRRAISLAKDAALRRRYLVEAMEGLPDYTDARSAFLSAPYAKVSAELEAIRRSGLAERDPERWHELQHQAEQARMVHEDVLANDRRINSGSTGKALLTSHLRDGIPFILVLRSFDLESRFVNLPDASRDEFSDILRPVDDQTRTVIASGHRITRVIIERIAPDCPSLLVANAQDPIPPEAAAKLFAFPSDWRRLVFAMAVEASAVVVAVPNAYERLSAGLSDELRALVELGEAEKAVVILEPSLRAPWEPAAGSDAKAFERVRAEIQKRGFQLVVTEQEIEDDFERVIGALQDLLAQSRSHALREDRSS
jgi:hypothetical protein